MFPQEFDWRTDAKGKDCRFLREIRDKANCGSCWAFGSVEAMTDRRCIASKGRKKKEHLSAFECHFLLAACYTATWVVMVGFPLLSMATTRRMESSLGELQ